MVAVVTCDIIKSRRYNVNERKEVDNLIRQAFAETIELFPDAQADKLSFNIIQGDEFQFVIDNPALAYRFVVFSVGGLYPPRYSRSFSAEMVQPAVT